MTRHNHFVTVVLEIVREPGKSGGAIGFALNFLWLLSLFQDKESDNDPKFVSVEGPMPTAATK